jgi:hypothetical protein
MKGQVVPFWLRAESPDAAPMQLAICPVREACQHQTVLTHALHSIPVEASSNQMQHNNAPFAFFCAQQQNPAPQYARLFNPHHAGLTLHTAASPPLAPRPPQPRWPQPDDPVHLTADVDDGPNMCGMDSIWHNMPGRTQHIRTRACSLSAYR